MVTDYSYLICGNTCKNQQNVDSLFSSWNRNLNFYIIYASEVFSWDFYFSLVAAFHYVIERGIP